jgi:hypothetical protein
MMDVWHTQLRLVARHFPDSQLRAWRQTSHIHAGGGVFCYVVPTVANRNTVVPPNVVKEFRELGFTIIRVEEPR